MVTEGECDRMDLCCNGADGGGMCLFDCDENDDDGTCKDDDTGDCE